MISDKSVVRMRIAHYFEFMRYNNNNFMLRQSIIGSSQLLTNNVLSLFYRHNHAVVWEKMQAWGKNYYWQCHNKSTAFSVLLVITLAIAWPVVAIA